MGSFRLHITGASGAGSTTLGEALAARLSFSHFDADDYFWFPTQPPYQMKREREERLRMILDDLVGTRSGAVVSGSVCNWGAPLEDSFDMVVYLHIPSETRLERLRAREITRRGEVNEEFIAWAARYDDGDLTVRSRRLHEAWLSSRHCEILRLEDDLTVEERVSAVLQWMPVHVVENGPGLLPTSTTNSTGCAHCEPGVSQH